MSQAEAVKDDKGTVHQAGVDGVLPENHSGTPIEDKTDEREQSVHTGGSKKSGKHSQKRLEKAVVTLPSGTSQNENDNAAKPNTQGQEAKQAEGSIKSEHDSHVGTVIKSSSSHVGDRRVVDPTAHREVKMEFEIDETNESDKERKGVRTETGHTEFNLNMNSAQFGNWLVTQDEPDVRYKTKSVVNPAHPDWEIPGVAGSQQDQKPLDLIKKRLEKLGPILPKQPPRELPQRDEAHALCAPPELWKNPWEHLMFYWEDWLETISGAPPRRSLTKKELSRRISLIFGYPPMTVYSRFLDINAIPWEEMEIVLYILGCIRMPTLCSELPPQIAVYVANSPELRRVITQRRNSEELRWKVQSSHGNVQPATFVEALIEEGQVTKVGKAKHHFSNDEQHPFCPARSIEDHEVHDHVREKWKQERKKKTSTTKSKVASGTTTGKLDAEGMKDATGTKSKVPAGGEASAPPQSSILVEHPDEHLSRDVEDWIRTQLPVDTSTPSKDTENLGNRTVPKRVSRDHMGIPGNVLDVGASIRNCRMFQFRYTRPVEMTCTWGPSVCEQLQQYQVRQVYLYRTRDDWVVAIGKGVGDMPHTLYIDLKLFVLYICDRSRDVGYNPAHITAHDEKGRAIGWYAPADMEADPQPFRTAHAQRAQSGAVHSKTGRVLNPSEKGSRHSDPGRESKKGPPPKKVPSDPGAASHRGGAGDPPDGDEKAVIRRQKSDMAESLRRRAEESAQIRKLSVGYDPDRPSKANPTKSAYPGDYEDLMDERYLRDFYGSSVRSAGAQEDHVVYEPPEVDDESQALSSDEENDEQMDQRSQLPRHPAQPYSENRSEAQGDLDDNWEPPPPKVRKHALDEVEFQLQYQGPGRTGVKNQSVLPTSYRTKPGGQENPRVNLDQPRANAGRGRSTATRSRPGGIRPSARTQGGRLNDLGQPSFPYRDIRYQPKGYPQGVDHLLNRQNVYRDRQVAEKQELMNQPVRTTTQQVPPGYVECPPGYTAPVGASILRLGGKEYFQLQPDGMRDPAPRIQSATDAIVDNLMLGSAPCRVELPPDGYNVGDVTVVTGFPRGHPCLEEGMPQSWEDIPDRNNPDVGRVNPTQKLLTQLSRVGTGKVRKFAGGSAVQLCYFINEFAEEMNALYIPFKYRGFALRRYLTDAAYKKIITPLDRIGKGNDYAAIVNYMFSVYHPPGDMELAARKLETVQQNGMSAHDYADWIKYLAMLAIPPNVSIEQHRRREALEVKRFIRTLDNREERLYLAKEKFPTIDAAVNALEDYYLICAGSGGASTEQRLAEMSNAMPHSSINTVAPCSMDWKLKGASATQEDMVAYLKWQRTRGCRANRDGSPVPSYSVEPSLVGVVHQPPVPTSPKKWSDKSQPAPAVQVQKDNSNNENKKGNSKKKKKKNQNNQNNQSDGVKPSFTVEDLTKTLQTVMSDFMTTMRRDLQSGGRDGNRPCNSTCWRCNKKGHISRNCPNPVANGVMCVTGYDLVCSGSGGGSHSCQCGTCHWTTQAPADKGN